MEGDATTGVTRGDASIGVSGTNARVEGGLSDGESLCSGDPFDVKCKCATESRSRETGVVEVWVSMAMSENCLDDKSDTIQQDEKPY